MKKWIVAIALLLTAGVIGIYFYIPGTLDISAAVRLNGTPESIFRNLSNQQNWGGWWPAEKEARQATGKNFLQLNNVSFAITNILRNSMEIQMIHAGTSVNSQMNLLPLANDSVNIEWHSQIKAGLNPIERIRLYRQAVLLKESMGAVLNALSPYLSNLDNVYGIPIKESSTNDSLLIATKTIAAEYPSTSFIYDMIGQLKKFCGDRGVAITGHPMLNITKLYPVHYQVMVALPISQHVQDSGSFFARKLVRGKFIVTEITGGPYSVDQAFKKIQLYFQDYRRTSMAIPFESLMTDRSIEPDTSKWITRIYAPVY